MRFRAEPIAAALVTALLITTPSAQEPAAAPAISEQQVADALAAVKADPNLGGERKMRMLRWRDRQRTPTNNFGWLRWIAGLFGWLTQSARYLVWVAVALLAGWLGVYIWRAVRVRQA